MRIPISCITVILLFTLASSAAALAADPATRPATRPTAVNPAIAALKQAREDLESNDPDRVAAAIKSIRELVVTRKNDAALNQGADMLLKAKKFEEVDSMCLASILAHSDVPYWVSKCQRDRTLALMGQGKTEEALSAAKAYYNVALITETNEGVNLVAACLEKARPDGKALAERFKRQQSAWANPKYSPPTTRSSTPTTQSSGDDDLGDPILATIKIDPKPFQDALDALVPEKYGSFVARGNLLLLCDQPAEAKDAFEQSLDAAQGERVQAAVLNITRAIRARDGCLGPAAAYYVSAHKKTEATN